MTKEELENYNKKLLQSDIDNHNKIVLLSKKVNDLQKKNAELEAKWLQATDEGTSWAHRKSLEQENAELKEQNRKLLESCEGATMMYEHLIKAKKIIKDLCGMVRELNKPNVQLTNVDYSLSEAEQFLKDSEVEKCGQ